MEAVAPSCRHRGSPVIMVKSSKTGIREEKMLKSQKKLTLSLLRLNHGGKPHRCVMRKSPAVLGLHGKVLILGSHKAGFCEKLLEDLPVPDRANSSCSKRDLLLDKDQPTGNNGSALGKSLHSCSWKRKERKSGAKLSLGRRDGWG